MLIMYTYMHMMYVYIKYKVYLHSIFAVYSVVLSVIYNTLFVG
jgi:hypothetical protein